ncbi:MAG TPA: hypothetical protein VER03_02945 [Bryobacteraceae bacterium]|nr:hypothetical protein [Bryobacteraceae bacterium]
MRRREFLLVAGFEWLWPGNWFRRRVRIASASFREIRNGQDRRRYIWIHGDERTAQDVLRLHIRSVNGRAFLIENDRRNISLTGGDLDPNRMFSRAGAEMNLRRLNPTWDNARVERALQQLDKDRNRFLARILPAGSGGLVVALHNNGPAYSVNDEVPISDSVALKDPAHPDEFMLCTARADFDKLSTGSFNVVLQEKAPPDDDGSLSRLCAARGVRYVNIEAAHGNGAGQAAMLQWLEKTL